MLWIPEPRRNGPATELRATDDISFADKIFCRSQNRGLLVESAAAAGPELCGCLGAFPETQLIWIPIPST